MRNWIAKKQRMWLIGLLIGYSLLLAYWMLFGFHRIPSEEFRWNLIPFETIATFLQIERFNMSVWVINLVGNIGVFVPFGILLPMCFSKTKTALGEKDIPRVRFLRVYLLFILGILLLEVLQLVLKRGSFDVDDLILNSLGYWIGFWCWKVIRQQS